MTGKTGPIPWFRHARKHRGCRQKMTSSPRTATSRPAGKLVRQRFATPPAVDFFAPSELSPAQRRASVKSGPVVLGHLVSRYRESSGRRFLIFERGSSEWLYGRLF